MRNKPRGTLSQTDQRALQYLLDRGPQYDGDLKAKTGLTRGQLTRLYGFGWIIGHPQIKLTAAGEMKLRGPGQSTQTGK